MTADARNSPVIVRVWRGVAAVGEGADAYLEHVENKVLPSLRSIPGYRGAQVLRRHFESGIEFVVITSWNSMDAIRAFAGENPERSVVEPEARAVLIEFEEIVRHYELVRVS